MIKISNNPRAEYHKEWYLKNKEKHKGQQQKRMLDDKEAYLEYRRNYMKVYRSSTKGRVINARSSSKRRALLRGVPSDKYSRLDVFMLAKGRCILCGQAIDIDLKWPHPRSYTTEHIISISKGGSDTLGNVSAAHLDCNRGQANKIRWSI